MRKSCRRVSDTEGIFLTTNGSSVGTGNEIIAIIETTICHQQEFWMQRPCAGRRLSAAYRSFSIMVNVMVYRSRTQDGGSKKLDFVQEKYQNIFAAALAWALACMSGGQVQVVRVEH